MPKSRLNLLFLFFQLLTLQFLSIISAIRKDIGFQETPFCKTTVQGRYLLSDDNGYVCDAVSVDPQSRCCAEKGEKFSWDAIFFHSAATHMNIVFHAVLILQEL